MVLIRVRRLHLRISPATTTAIVLGLVAVAVSAVGSWIPSLWGDEGTSLLSAERSIPSLLHMLGHVDAVHGTYYFFLHYWIRIFGITPFAIRFPSAIAVGLCVVAVVLIGSRLRSLPVGAVAGIVCAVLPRMTYVGEEARSYAFTTAIAAWLTLLLIIALGRAGEGRRARGLWIAYGVLLTIGVYVFLYLALMAVAHGLVLLIAARHRSVLVPWVIAAGAAGVASVPIIAAGFLERAQIAFLATQVQVTASSILVDLWFGQVPFAILGWLLTLGGIAIAVVPWLRRRACATRSPITLLLVSWFLVPSVILIGTSPLINGFTARYLALCSPAVALLMTLSIAWLAARWRPALVLGTAAVVGLAIPPWIQERGPYAKNDSDWAVISADLARVASPGDAVVFDESTRPSRRPRLALETYPIATRLKDPTRATPFWKSSTWHDDVMSIPTAAARGRFDGIERVWLVEYAIGGKVDRYGIADLEHLGFTRGREITNHRSRIIEFDRPA